MHPDTLAFLEALFAPCGQGFLTFTAIHPDGQHPTPSRHVPVADRGCLTRTLDRLIATNEQGWGAYVGVSTRKTNLGRWRRGGKMDLLGLPALFADIDRPPEVVLHELQNFHPTPSCIVASGRGVHLYWMLSRLTQDIQQARHVLRGLATALHGDVMSPAQSMRLVGSHNTKLRAGGELCRLLEFHPERRYLLDDFAQYASLPRQTGSLSPRKTNGGLNPRVMDELADLFLAHRYKSRGTWLNGPCVFPERHKHADSHSSFGYNMESGRGYCFVCGPIPTAELCQVLSICPATDGGLYRA